MKACSQNQSWEAGGASGKSQNCGGFRDLPSNTVFCRAFRRAAGYNSGAEERLIRRSRWLSPPATHRHLFDQSKTA